MSAEPAKVENQVAGEAPAPATADSATQPTETKVADTNPPAVEEAAPAAASAEAPADSKPAAEAAAPAATEETAAKEEPKDEPKDEAKDKEQPKEEPKDEAKDKEQPKEEAPKETPLTKLANRLPEIMEKAGHGEMWGVQLSGLEHAPTAIVLQKYLRANDDNVNAAATQLTSALEWRKKNNPTSLLDDKVYDRSKFGDLGFVTDHKDDKGKDVVITWNVYGAVKNNKATFGNINEFLEWRVALMEFGTRKLNINEATAPIPDGAEDPYRMVQVHDYLSVAFLRMDPHIKAASKETIQTLSMAYPELLAHKYFVNVPTIMSWAFSAMKLFLSPATLRKFHPLSSGASLATEMPSIASSLPKEYGGSGASVKEGLTVKLSDAPAADKGKEDEPAAAAAEEAAPKKEEEPKETPKKEAEEAKDAPAAEAVEAKPEEPKAEEVKAEEPKTEEPKAENGVAKDATPAESAAKDEPAAESKEAETKA